MIEKGTTSTNNDPTEDQYSKAARLFSDFKPGLTLSITRLQPTWCSGFLEKIDCFDDQPIDIEYIISKWGGKRLRLRLCDSDGKYCGGTDLNLSSYKPRIFGRVTTQQDEWDSDGGQGGPSPKPQQIHKPERNDSSTIELIKAMAQQRQSDIATIKDILTPKVQPVAPQSVQETSPTNQMDQMMDTFTKMSKMQKMFAGMAGYQPTAAPTPDDAGGDDNMLGQIMSLVSMFKPNAAPQPPAAAPQPPAAAPQPAAARRPRVVADAEQPISPQVDLTKTLSEIPVEQLSAIMLTTLQNRSENDRETVIGDFLEKTGLDKMLQRNLGDDSEYEDDPEYDEMDDEIGNSPDNERESQRRPLRADAGHDPNNR